MTIYERRQKLKWIKEKAIQKGERCQCMADEIKLYYRYILDYILPIKSKSKHIEIFGGYDYSEIEQALRSETERLYYEIRGNDRFVGFIPSSTAAAIVCIASEKTDAAVTKKEICEILKINYGAVRYVVEDIKHILKLDPICHCRHCKGTRLDR